jgi:ubiquinol-cytochrome c reductase cytochrome b subunit
VADVTEPEKVKNIHENSRGGRLFRWFDRRTGLGRMMRASLDEPIPGGARLAYVFGSGLLFIFISQVITGLCLTLYYVPSAETAHTSVAYITKQVAAGAFLRSLHYYGSSAMIIVLLLHFLQTFLYGSYKGRREVLWISGAVLSFLVLGMGFTGYLLPWDQKAYFATAVGTNIVGQVPLIGPWLTELLRGGDTLGTLTLSRFYVAHVFLIPGAIFLFIGIHIALFRKAGPAGPIQEDPVHPKLPPEGFYPRQVLMDMGFALLLVAGLGVLAYFHPVELGPIANPANTQFLPRPEWYYLPMFEWLKFWEGPEVVFAIVVVPGILALLFFLLPFLDRGLERRPWRRPIPLLGVSIVLVGMIFLGIKSHLDDERDPSIAAQLAIQAQQEKEYTKAPFHPYMESPGGTGPMPTGPVDPAVAQGKGIFDAHGCSGCHGQNGTGAIAVSLVGVTGKFSTPQLIALLHHPNAKMRAGGMPAVDLPDNQMSALLKYLSVLGTGAANVPAASPESAASPAVPESLPVSGAEKTAAANERGQGAGKTSPGSTVASEATLQAGAELFQSHGCFACHGAAGAGTARVPPLAGLIAGQSDAQISALLHHPDAKMSAGGMPPLTATPAQEASLIAYLRSLHPAHPAAASSQSVAANPPRQQALTAASPAATSPVQSVRSTAPPTANVAQQSPAALGREIFVSNGCSACHGSNGTGTQFAPSLVGITNKFPGAKLPYLLHHPTKKMRDGGMPVVNVHGADMQHLVAYLASLGTSQPSNLNGTTSANAAAGAASNSALRQTPPAGNRMTSPANAPSAHLSLSPAALRGQKIFQHYSCETCHGIGGLHGTVAAPPLAGTASTLPASVLENLLRHHSIQMQKGGMPLTNMNARDMRDLVAYIRSMPSGNPAQ